jgi:hypothetical protein
MLFPAVEPGSGPFQGRPHRWSVPEAAIPDGQRAVAASWYLALMAAHCLELIGAEGPVVLEGPLAGNAELAAMLSAVVPAGLATAGRASTGTSAGAALLALPPDRASLGPAPSAPAHLRAPRLAAYAARWRAEVLRAT